jgi:hypothetical protein
MQTTIFYVEGRTMLRNAVVIGVVSALVLFAAFAFYITDLSNSLGPRGERVLVCHLPSHVVNRTDEYAIACAKLVGWALDREVVIDRPSPTPAPRPRDMSPRKPATGTFPVGGPTASATTRPAPTIRPR